MRNAMVPIRLTYWLIGVTKLLERSCQAYPANCILKVFSEKFSLLVLFCPNCEPCFTGYLAVLWKQLHSVARDLTQSLWWVLHFIASNRRAALLKGQRGGGIKIGGETCFRIVFSYFLYKLNVTFDLILRCLEQNGIPRGPMIVQESGPQTEKWENLNGTKFFCCL